MAHLRWCCTGRLAMTIFSTTERYNIVATLNRMVAMLFQHSKAVLRLKPSMQIISCNITFKSIHKKCKHLLPSLHFLVISSQVKWVFTEARLWMCLYSKMNQNFIHVAIYNYRSFYVTRLSAQCWWSQSQKNWSNFVIVYPACMRIWHTL